MKVWDAARRMDARLTIALGLWLGILVWQTTFVGLGVYTLFLALLFTAAPLQSQAVQNLRPLITLAVLFASIKATLDLLGGAPLDQAAREAALLGSRLGVLLAAGVVLTTLASPRALGIGFAWYLRPVLGRQAWKAALALALMIHFQPLVWGVYAQIRQTISHRCPALGLRSSLELYAAAGLRVLSQKTWAQTMAIAARRLDNADAWPTPGRFVLWQVASACLLAAAAWLLARV